MFLIFEFEYGMWFNSEIIIETVWNPINLPTLNFGNDITIKKYF